MGDSSRPKPVRSARSANTATSRRRLADSGGRMSRVPTGARNKGWATTPEATATP